MLHFLSPWGRQANYKRSHVPSRHISTLFAFFRPAHLISPFRFWFLQAERGFSVASPLFRTIRSFYLRCFSYLTAIGMQIMKEWKLTSQFSEQYPTMLKATGCSEQAELAQRLGIRQCFISDSRRRNAISHELSMALRSYLGAEQHVAG